MKRATGYVSLPWYCGVLWCGCVLWSPLAGAQEGPELLREADAAYADIDYERAGELAQEALESGGLGPADTSRVYELIGITAAANGDEEGSRDAYIRMLAINPSAQADSNLAPRLRSPFLEARGFWAGRRQRLAIEVDQRSDDVRVRVVDPVAMALTLVARYRGADAADFDERRGSASEPLVIPLEEGGVYELHLEDEYGNRLLERGSDDEARVADAIVSGGTGSDDETGEGRGVPLWVWIGAGVLAAGLLTTGIVLGTRTRPITLEGGVRVD
ncbi:MAG: hypothetical protein AAF645_12305 [Myxococcota bacterium]